MSRTAGVIIASGGLIGLLLVWSIETAFAPDLDNSPAAVEAYDVHNLDGPEEK